MFLSRLSLLSLMMAMIMALSSLHIAFAEQFSEKNGQNIYRLGRYDEALTHWEKAAANGDSGAAYRLAQEYFDAIVVERDLVKVITYLNQASADGDPRAMAELGDFYVDGNGVPQDLEKAAQLYLQAANKGWGHAMFNIATMYADGEGIEKNQIEAYKFYSLSQDRGFAPLVEDALGKLSAKMSAKDIKEAQKRVENFRN